MHTILITGANRGIGLECAKQYAEAGWKVIATCRHPSKAEALAKLKHQHKNMEIYKLDIDNPEHLDALHEALDDEPIDVLLNNAGIIGDRISTLEDVSHESLLDAYTTNAISPLLLAREFVHNLREGKLKTIANISSIAGSISSSLTGAWNLYAYKASKAALNMLMICMSTEETYSDLRILLLHPGWVHTDMGGPEAPVTVQDSVQGLRRVISDMQIKSGTFVDYQGNRLDW